MLKDIIKKPYYYVPPCPYCGSYVTGRYVKKYTYENGWVTMESLRNGEIVKEVYEIPNDNCFCEECGFEWPYPVTMKMMSLNQIKKEKLARQTGQSLDEQYSKQDKDFQKKKFKLLRKFIGRV